MVPWFPNVLSTLELFMPTPQMLEGYEATIFGISNKWMLVGPVGVYIYELQKDV